MLAIFLSSLFVAAAPAQEVIEDLEIQEVVASEDYENAASEDLECLEEIVLEDAECEESIAEDAIAFDEE